MLEKVENKARPHIFFKNVPQKLHKCFIRKYSKNVVQKEAKLYMGLIMDILLDIYTFQVSLYEIVSVDFKVHF